MILKMALSSFFLITFEILQLANQYRCYFLKKHDGYFELNRNNPSCNTWKSIVLRVQVLIRNDYSASQEDEAKKPLTDLFHVEHVTYKHFDLIERGRRIIRNHLYGFNLDMTF